MSPDPGRPSRASTTIISVAAALMALGVVMVFSAGASLDSSGPLADPLHNPSVRQAAFTIAALLVVLIVSVVPYSLWAIRSGRISQPALWLPATAAALCALVLVPGLGTVRNGARRWLTLGPASMGLSFQPSELAKVAVVVFTAAYCVWRGSEIRRFWRGLMPALLVIAALAGLIGKEDFGTAALIGLVGGSMLLAGGTRLLHLLICAVPAAAGAVMLVLAEPYRRQRLLGFQHIWDDPLGKGYHQVQSLLTIASGGWWGLGLGGGVQKYGYLPEARSDFIFAVICEELGMAGGIAVIGLFLVLIWQGRRAVTQAVDDLGRLLALGATMTVGVQAALNIAVVTVSVPTKGIALPLISAGGSGVVFLGVLIGMLANVARLRRPIALSPPDAKLNMQGPAAVLSGSTA